MLLDVVRKGAVTDETAASFFAAATTVASSHDLGRVRALAGHPNLSEAVLTGLLRASMPISGSHDRAMLLLDILTTRRLSGASRQLLVDAAQELSSAHDQNRVLAELVRSERR